MEPKARHTIERPDVKRMIRLIGLAIALTLVGTPFCEAQSAQLSLQVSRHFVVRGDVFDANLTVSVEPAETGEADIFFGAVMPTRWARAHGCADEAAVFLGPGSTVVLRCLTESVATFPPLLSGLPLTPGTSPLSSLHVPWGSDFPGGSYTFFAVATRTGAFADGQIDRDDIISVAIAEVVAVSGDLPALVDALFLGSGPLRPRDGLLACPFWGFWSGFPRGTHVRLRIGSSVSTDKREAIRNAAAQVAGATGRVIDVSVEDDPEASPLPGWHEATSATVTNASELGCDSDNGCTIHRFDSPGVLISSRAVQPPGQTPNAYAHDIVGHGIIGMCHIDGMLIGGAGNSLMSGGPGVFSGDIALGLTLLDLDAIRAVYASPLAPGATRAEFVAADLVDP